MFMHGKIHKMVLTIVVELLTLTGPMTITLFTGQNKLQIGWATGMVQHMIIIIKITLIGLYNNVKPF